MANSFRVVLLLFLSFCTFSQAISVLNETIKCRTTCDRTYPLHTYPTVRHNRACQQGCYRAVKMKNWSAFGFHVKNCSEGCEEQYFDADSVYACKLGCNKGQGVNILEKTSHSPSKTLPSKSQHGTVAALILRPVMLLHTYGRGMINKLTYYVQSSTSYYFRTNNGGMVVVNIQREPEIYIKSADNGYLSNQNDEAQKPNTKIPQPQVYGDRRESWVVVRRGHHWLHCVSHKSGVPMWILSSILFLSSFFLLWLCCASTARNNKKPTEKKAFLIKDLLPVSTKKDGQDVPLLKLDDEDEQAGPLPSKTGAAVIINM